MYNYTCNINIRSVWEPDCLFYTFISDSSSVLSAGTTVSSLPAQKYFNSKKAPAPQLEGSAGKPGPTPKYSFGPLRNLPLNPEDDILYQWRLRRRLELAREEAEAVGEEGRRFRGGRGRGSGWRGGLLQGDLGKQVEQHCDGISGGEDVRLKMAAEEENIHCCVHNQTAHPPHVCGQFKILEQQRVVPPVTHHAPLQCCCKGAVPPHMHTSCDVIPCPCHAVGSGQTGEPESALGQEEAAGPTQHRRARRKKHSGSGGGRSDGAARSRDQARDLRTGQEEGEGTMNARTLKTATRDPIPCESQSSNFPVSTAANASIVHQPQLPNDGYKGTGQSAPVQYPSPSVLTRHRRRTKHRTKLNAAMANQQHPPGSSPPPARDTTTPATQSDSEADSLVAADSLHLSLSFSSEADQTLTPGRHGAGRQGDAAGDQPIGSAAGGPSITPVVSKVRIPACMMSVRYAIFVSQCHLVGHLP